MSGHSKWSTIKRKKGAADAKRGQIFTRLAREIAISTREGGGDPDSNFRLRLAVDRARENNMPKDNIERATDNRNRAVADIRHVLNRYGGSLGESGSVGWQFQRKAYFSFPAENHDPDKN